jgi:hypothetical protein
MQLGGELPHGIEQQIRRISGGGAFALPGDGRFHSRAGDGRERGW